MPAEDVSLMQHVDVATAHCQKLKHEDISVITPKQPGPSMWSVLQKWILALPTTTEEQRQRRLSLQKELERVVSELDDGKGLGDGGVRSASPSYTERLFNLTLVGFLSL